MQNRDVGVDVRAQDSTGACDGPAVGLSVELMVPVVGLRVELAVPPASGLPVVLSSSGQNTPYHVIGLEVGCGVEGTLVGELVGTALGSPDGTGVNAPAGPVAAESVGPLGSPKPDQPVGPVPSLGPTVPMDGLVLLVCVFLGITAVLDGRL